MLQQHVFVSRQVPIPSHVCVCVCVCVCFVCVRPRCPVLPCSTGYMVKHLRNISYIFKSAQKHTYIHMHIIAQAKYRRINHSTHAHTDMIDACFSKSHAGKRVNTVSMWMAVAKVCMVLRRCFGVPLTADGLLLDAAAYMFSRRCRQVPRGREYVACLRVHIAHRHRYI